MDAFLQTYSDSSEFNGLLPFYSAVDSEEVSSSPNPKIDFPEDASFLNLLMGLSDGRASEGDKWMETETESKKPLFRDLRLGNFSIARMEKKQRVRIPRESWDFTDHDLVKKWENYIITFGSDPMEDDVSWQKFSLLIYNELSPSNFTQSLKERVHEIKKKYFADELTTRVLERISYAGAAKGISMPMQFLPVLTESTLPNGSARDPEDGSSSPPLPEAPNQLWDLTGDHLLKKIEEYKLIYGRYPMENDSSWGRFCERIYDELSPSQFARSLKERVLAIRNRFLREEPFTRICKSIWSPNNL